MRTFLKALLTLVVVLALLLAIVAVKLGPITHSAINRYGPALLGVPVSVDTVTVSPRRGQVLIDNLLIGNPPGFASPFLFRIDQLRVNVALVSLFSQRIHVREIVVDGPAVWYEQTLVGSNVKAFQAILAAKSGGTAAGLQDDQPDTAGQRPARKVLIDHVRVEQGRVGLKMGVGGEISLPAVELRDIGKDEPEGVTLSAALEQIVGAMLASVAEAVKSVVDLSGKNIKALSKGSLESGKRLSSDVGQVGKSAGDVGKDLGKSLKNRLKGLTGEE